MAESPLDEFPLLELFEESGKTFQYAPSPIPVISAVDDAKAETSAFVTVALIPPDEYPPKKPDTNPTAVLNPSSLPSMLLNPFAIPWPTRSPPKAPMVLIATIAPNPSVGSSNPITPPAMPPINPPANADKICKGEPEPAFQLTCPRCLHHLLSHTIDRVC